MVDVAERKTVGELIGTEFKPRKEFQALPDVPIYSIHDHWWSWILYKATQKVLLVATYVLMYGFTRFTIKGKENLKDIKGPVLIVANHKSYYDPPMIGLAFPFFSKIYPFRFMTFDGFFKHWWTRWIYKAMGCYPAYRGRGIEKSLEAPKLLLKKGETVIFFPEGKCVREDGLGCAKRGVGVLALQVPNIPIVPISIKGTQKVTRNIFTRPRVEMKIGKSFILNPEQMDHCPVKSSEFIMQRVAELYHGGS